MADKTILIYFDGAGNLHENDPSSHFILGGYVFFSYQERDSAKREYIKKSKAVRNKIKHQGELKAKNLAFDHPKEQTKLIRLMNKYQSMYVHVDRSKIYKRENITEKKHINNYKVYCMTLLIRELFQQLLFKNIIDDQQSIELKLYIDQDKRSTSGWYELDESIRKELLVGKYNYLKDIKPVFDKSKPEIDINVQQFNSECEPLGQSADMLVNRLWHNYENGVDNKFFHIKKEMP
ncbi:MULTISPECIES: DUF3800 domain-containing protein [Fructobacillus]|uniref:DUF3800 domain-containing protein n=1 Tax=Fructobacillus americanaquae TaxID=2940302 RepID=A0ABY5C3Z6_9LACO|nr:MULTISPECIES: DUF3800 domain-containing protein [Fructobacillus]MCK8627738.1 DUF3800 domain-containing protein [Fructobacillus cardui]USS92050.1 DUF3800 domain-containing protein [Fructobacillus americanaquae]GIC70635.1 hypothetical protein FT12353_13110 [Fructobacillus tropaeoli]